MQSYINLSTNEHKIDINSVPNSFSIKQYDNKSRVVHMSLIDKDNPNEKIINLENHTVRIYFRLPDGSTDMIDGEIINPDEGEISITIPNSVTQLVGTVLCEVGISNNTDGSFMSMRVFRFFVEESIRDNEAIEATEKFSALDNALNTVYVTEMRVNQLTSLPEGSTTGDAELMDIRVGADGKVYENAGASVRGQINSHTNDINAIKTNVSNTNILLYGSDDMQYNEVSKSGTSIQVANKYGDTNVQITADDSTSYYVGAKNILPSNLMIDGELVKTLTKNGLTMTINNNGSISLSGTASAGTTFAIKDTENYNDVLPFQPGNYVFSGKLDGDASGSLSLKITEWGNATNAIVDTSIASYRKELTVDISLQEPFYTSALQIYVATGRIVNATLYLQLEYGSAATDFSPMGGVGEYKTGSYTGNIKSNAYITSNNDVTVAWKQKISGNATGLVDKVEINTKAIEQLSQKSYSLSGLQKYNISYHNRPKTASNINVTISSRVADGSASDIPNSVQCDAVNALSTKSGISYMWGRHNMAVNPTKTTVIKCADKCTGNDVSDISKRFGNWELTFAYDGSEFELCILNQFAYRLLVDEGGGWEYINESFSVLGDNDGYRRWFKFSFTSDKMRKIKFEMSQVSFGGIIYNQTYSISPVAEDIKPLIVFQGSSITESYSVVNYSHLGWPYLVSQSLGAECINVGVGGTGFVANAGKASIPDRMQTDVYPFAPDILFIGGSINDTDATADEFTAAIDKTLSGIKKNIPSCLTILLGTFVPRPTGRENSYTVKNNIMREKALEHNLPFVDELNGIVYDQNGNILLNTGRWITGSGQTSNQKGDGNSDRYIGDGTHLNIAGHEYIAERLTRVALELMHKS